jgi:hypothetical protein
MAPDIPEPPHRPHGGSSLPRWLEWTAAISALVISVCSIGIAVYNARIESRLLKASSYPYLVSGVSDATPDGPKRISIELLNNGVGPADERSLKIKLGGRYVTNVKDFIRTAMGAGEADKAGELLQEVHDNEITRFIAAKDRGMIFRIDKTPQNARYWELLDDGMNAKGVSLEYCYCSVFEECWAVQGDVRKPVKACLRDPHLEFRPQAKVRSVASPLPQG